MIDGVATTVQRRIDLAPIGPEFKTAESVRELARKEFHSRKVNKPKGTLGAGRKFIDFVESVYLPYAEKQKKAST